MTLACYGALEIVGVIIIIMLITGSERTYVMLSPCVKWYISGRCKPYPSSCCLAVCSVFGWCIHIKQCELWLILIQLQLWLASASNLFYCPTEDKRLSRFGHCSESMLPVPKAFAVATWPLQRQWGHHSGRETVWVVQHHRSGRKAVSVAARSSVRECDCGIWYVTTRSLQCARVEILKREKE